MKPVKSENTNAISTEIFGFKDFNIKDLVLQYLKYWYWFVLCILMFISLAYLKLRYSTPLYDVASTIVISQEDNLSNAGLSAFKDLGISQSQDKIVNEIQILKSKTLIKKVITSLQLNIQYFHDGRVLKIEEYKNPLVNVTFLADKNLLYKQYGTFIIQIESNSTFSFIDEDHNTLSKHNFNQPVPTKLGKVIVTPNTALIQNTTERIIKINVMPVNSLVDNYRARLNISGVGQNSSVLQVSLRDAIIKRAEDFINSLINEYSLRDIANKTETSQKTTEFINERLLDISKGLSDVDNEAAKYMSKYSTVAGLSKEGAGELSEISSENNKDIIFLETQQLLLESTINFIENKKSKNDLIPSSFNIDDTAITTDIGKYNLLVLKRKRLLKTSSTQNPIIIKIDDELNGLREVLFQNLNNAKNRIEIKLNSFKQKEKEVKTKLSQVPDIQKDLREIVREQSVTENLYLYLLQKKEEAGITSHITVPNSRVLDRASPISLVPVSPSTKSMYLLAIILGILVPFSILYIKRLLNTNVKSKKDIEAVLSVPFVGSIPKGSSKEKFAINKSNNTPISEAFRILRSNLDFLLRDISKTNGKTIFVTSSISGEGKSFISSNIAQSLAIIGKKVAYIGVDFRLPKFHEIFDLPEGKMTVGFSNFISDDGIEIPDIIIQQRHHDNLFIIPPGAIPPNPSKLLMHDRVKTMFNYLEDNFDYIVVDTAPISLVTDTLLISHYADLTVHVVKEDYSDKRLLSIPEMYKNDGRLVNLTVLLNFATSNMSGTYGYGYGYSAR